MKRILLLVAAGGLLAPGASLAAPAPYFVNPANAVVVQHIQIDAINFTNFGAFNLGLVPYLPFETFNTLNYANYGLMQAAPGWRFGLNSTVTGLRSWSDTFVNFNPGVIIGLDTDNLASSVLGNPCVIARVDPSFVHVFATNIVGRAGVFGAGASLVAGPNGEIRLVGHNVDLSRSGLEVLPIWSEATTLLTQTLFVNNPPASFIPDIAVFDQEWASGNYSQQFGLGTGALWNGLTATAPAIPMNQGAAPAAFPGFSFSILGSSAADSFVFSQFQGVTLTNFIWVTNIITDTNCMPPVTVTNIDQMPATYVVTIRSNVVKGAVFVGVPPGFNVPQIGFTPTTVPNNPIQGASYQRASVLISVLIPNAVTGLLEPAYIRVDDTLASTPGLRGVIPNEVGCGAETSRPVNYSVDRQPLVAGAPGNHGYPEPNFLVSSSSAPFPGTNLLGDSVTNFTVIAGDFAAYTGFFDNIVSRPPSVPGGTVSNTPGRVVISANTLDLSRARLRGEGGIFIDSPHLVSSAQAVVDAENLSFSLGSTNGHLRVQSLVPPSGFVQRLRGPVSVWSAIWQNTSQVQLGPNYLFTNVPVMSACTNVIIGTNTLVLDTTNVTANVVTYFQVLMVDATQLTTVLPVNVYDLVTRSPDTVLDDNMTVLQSLRINGRSLTLNGSITIPGFFPVDPLTGLPPTVLPLLDWAAPNAPNLLWFTNNGTLSVPNAAHFGDDRAEPYSGFVNRGSIFASSLDVHSFYFENRSNLFSTFGLNLRGSVGKLEDGNSTSGGSTSISANDVKFNRYTINAGDALNFNVTGSLSDAGAGSGNFLSAQDGFNLMTKPKTGDLLGTRLVTQAPNVPSVQINHSWAGEDRGPTPAGFTDNVALGALQISSLSPDPFFLFGGTGAHNGLYVDQLDLNAFTTESDLLSRIAINPNLTIYFASASLGYSPPVDTNGIAQSPEEYLDGKFGGRLRWVQSYGGPSSSVVVNVNGQPTPVNSALLNSQILDSDQDGIPNYVDATPFQGAALTVSTVGNGTVNPNYNGQTLLVGQQYSLSAQPADGFVFTGWTGSTNTAASRIQFLMTNGLAFTANFKFVLNPGSYNGLFYEDLPFGVRFQRSGAVTVTTTAAGKCSGSVEIGGKRYSFSGQLNTNGAATINIPTASLVIQLQAGNDQVTGTIGDGLTWTADLVADRAVFNGSLNKAPFSGKYTLVLPGTGDPSNTNVPQGDGYAAVSVTTAGKVKLTGALADGTRISDSSTVSADGNWPLYIPLNSGGGQLLGWLTFANTGDADVSGLISWIKQTNLTAKFYPAGFEIETNAFGSIYVSTNKPVTGFGNATLELSGGNLSGDINNLVSINPANKVTNLSSNRMTLKVNASQGLLSGNVVDPATGKTIRFNGVILQKQDVGSGFFLGTNQSGKVTLEP